MKVARAFAPMSSDSDDLPGIPIEGVELGGALVRHVGAIFADEDVCDLLKVHP